MTTVRAVAVAWEGRRLAGPSTGKATFSKAFPLTVAELSSAHRQQKSLSALPEIQDFSIHHAAHSSFTGNGSMCMCVNVA